MIELGKQNQDSFRKMVFLHQKKGLRPRNVLACFLAADAAAWTCASCAGRGRPAGEVSGVQPASGHLCPRSCSPGAGQFRGEPQLPWRCNASFFFFFFNYILIDLRKGDGER